MTRARLLAAAAAVAALFAIPVVPPAEAAGIGLTPHRAVYDLKLLHSRGKRSIERTAEIGEAVKGRGFNPPGVHVARGQSVSFGSSKRVGEDLV